jgi:type II secretory pathway pseudopilin PulG
MKSPFSNRWQKARRAITQVEMLVSAAVISILCAAIAVGAIMIQRNFRASGNYVAKEAAQMRLLDYLALDLRRALTVKTNNTTGTIELTMPDFYQSDGVPRMPTIKSGMAYYGNPSAPVQVKYYRSAGQLIREQNSQITNVATDVQDFDVTFRDEGQVIEVKVSFIPTFRPSGGSREGTTTVCRTLLRNKRQT